MGAPLARLGLTTAVTRLLARTRLIELDGTPQNAPGLVLRGFVSLPVRVIAA